MSFSPIFLSFAIRLWQERSLFFASAETALIWLLLERGHYGPLTFLLASLAFTLLAYIDTVVEYADYTQNLREQEALSSKLSQRYALRLRIYFVLTIERQSEDADVPFNRNDLHGKLTMFPCILRHIRRKAFKDDFQHKYLYIGVPVGLHADYAPLISVDYPSWRSAFSIRPQDQLIRGGIHLTLAQKLREFLEEQVDTILPLQVLVTNPATGRGSGSMAVCVLPDISDRVRSVQQSSLLLVSLQL